MNSKSYIIHSIFPVELFQAEISVTAKYLYFVLSSFANKDGVCFPRFATIKERAAIKDKKTIIKALKELENAGFVEIIRDTGKHNVYRLFPERKKDVKDGDSKSKRVWSVDLLDELRDFELNESDMKKIEGFYLKKGEEYVRNAIVYTKKRAKENKSAYLIKTLLNDWAKKEREENKENEKIEKAKEEYEKMIGKVVRFKNEKYCIYESGLVGDRDGVLIGDILKNWDKWKPVLLKNLVK